MIDMIYSNFMPVPFLSVITNACIKKEKNYNSAGARYNTNYIQGVGIGTITDSVAAIKYHIYEKQAFPWKN